MLDQLIEVTQAAAMAAQDAVAAQAKTTTALTELQVAREQHEAAGKRVQAIEDARIVSVKALETGLKNLRDRANMARIAASQAASLAERSLELAVEDVHRADALLAKATQEVTTAHSVEAGARNANEHARAAKDAMLRAL